MFISRELILFGIVGVVSTLIHFSVLFVLVEYFSLQPLLANLIAFFASLLGSYGLNHRYTFRSTLPWQETFPKYFTTVLIGLFLNQTIMWIVVDQWKISYLYGFAIVTVVVPLSNFMLHKYWTFSDKEPRNE